MNNWKYQKLSTLCSRIGDGLHGTPEYSENSDIYFINGNNLNSGKIEINSNTKKVSTTELQNNFIPLNENSLLLSINGTIGSMAFYNNEKVMLGKSAAYLNFNSGINKFYYYYFQLDRIQKYFYNVATGSTIKNLSLKSIQDFEVPVPKDIEWQKIASVLSSLDSKIELNNRINSELEAMAKTLYDYWFVQFDFPNAKGKPYKTSGGKMVWNDELKREIPEGWEVKKLKEIVRCNYDSISKDNIPNSINYLDTSSLTLNQINSLHCIEVKNEKIPSRAQRIVNKDDILYSTVRPNLRHFGIIKNPEENMIASTGFAQISSVLTEVKNEVIYLFLTSETIIDRLDQIASSAVSAYPSISHKDILELQLVFPCETQLLINIGQILEPIFDKISLIQKENQQLASLRDWLLPMLMNGQVKVGDVEEKLSMAAEPETKYGKK
jgi:type I restriction enzyme S subunit